jgi:hypothetical protein
MRDKKRGCAKEAAMSQRFAALLLAALALLSCKPAAREVTIENAWVRLPAVPGRPAAGYFTLSGSTSDKQVLIGVESSKARRIEMHSGGMAGGMMTMRPLAQVASGAEPRRFVPGGDHLMIFGVDPALRSGGEVPLRFRMKGGRAIDVAARAIGAGEAAPAF